MKLIICLTLIFLSLESFAQYSGIGSYSLLPKKKSAYQEYYSCPDLNFPVVDRSLLKIAGLGCLENWDEIPYINKISRDKSICTCLENESLSPKDTTTTAYKIMSLEKKARPINRDVTFSREVSRTWKEIEGMRIAESVASTIMFNEKPELAKYFKKDQEIVQNYFENEVDKAKGKISSNTILNVKNNIIKPYEVDLLTDKMPPGNCITPREYMAIQQLPHDEELQKAFLETPFKDENWDFEGLKEKYRELNKIIKGDMSEKTAQERGTRDLILKKLKFLNKNPMIKHMFDRKSKGPKEELMGILRSYKGDEKSNFLDKNYSEKLKLFFAQSKNVEIVKKISDKKWEDLITDLNKGKPKKGSRAVASAFTDSIIVTRDEINETILHDFGPGNSIDFNCSNLELKGERGVENCVRSYKIMCGALEDKKIIVFSDTRDWDIDEILNQDLDPDIQSSKGYQQFNNQLCTVATDREEISYSDFQKQSCLNLNLSDCREKFIEKYKNNLNPKFIEFANYIKTNPINQVSKSLANSIAESKPVDYKNKSMRSEFEDYRTSFSSKSPSPLVNGDRSSEKSLSSVNNVLASQSNTQDPYYPSTFVGSSPVAGSNNEKTQDINDYSREEKNSLLDEWKKEMEALQNTPASGPEGEARKLASEKALKERIAALETLLLQQKELSDRQYALLNDALKSREKELEKKISELEKDSEKKVSQGKKDTRTASSESEEGNFFRNPASVMRAPTAYQSGVGSGETAGARAGGASLASVQSSSQAMKEAANREALAREEAKLVKLRQESSGAIVLEGTKGNGANAIALAISDEFYKQARGNLAAINLKQVEKNIPKDQIDLLEKNGVITLILQNGHNPPLEVKVMRRDGQLVQLDNSPAVVRKFSLQGLQNSFRN